MRLQRQREAICSHLHRAQGRDAFARRRKAVRAHEASTTAEALRRDPRFKFEKGKEEGEIFSKSRWGSWV